VELPGKQGRKAAWRTYYDARRREPMGALTDGEERVITFWSFQRYMLKATFTTLPAILILIAAVVAILLIEYGSK
jgi:hypothetical protein